MSLKSFRVEGTRGLKNAECSSVPTLMIICGPNGSGKSTLLSAIKLGTGTVELTGDTDVALPTAPQSNSEAISSAPLFGFRHSTLFGHPGW